MKSQKQKGDKVSPFVRKLQAMLNDSQNFKIIRLNSSTRRLEILSKRKLTKILPMYFRHSQFQSFVRQLNWYGFYKINSKVFHSYAHPDLKQGRKISEIRSKRNQPCKKLQICPSSAESQNINGKQGEPGFPYENSLEKNILLPSSLPFPNYFGVFSLGGQVPIFQMMPMLYNPHSIQNGPLQCCFF